MLTTRSVRDHCGNVRLLCYKKDQNQISTIRKALGGDQAPNDSLFLDISAATALYKAVYKKGTSLCLTKTLSHKIFFTSKAKNLLNVREFTKICLIEDKTNVIKLKINRAAPASSR